MISEFDLSGQVAVVTGANRSIGRATSLALAEAGAAVLVSGRRSERLDELVDEIRGKNGRALPMICDVRDPQAVERLFQTCADELGPPDVVVANAGVFQEWGPSEELTPEEWDRVTAIDLKGVMLTCQAAGRSMIPRKRGSIVNISSIAGVVALPGAVAYSASKFGVIGLTRTLAAEWSSHDIRVNAIAPGFIERDDEPLKDDPATLEMIMTRTPLARWGQPREVALAAVYLASPASSFVTGATLAVDGGWLAI
jgi:NAD(P)-dependent dehydrogenase (short-subunit alcohol dehydrogenase family)